MPRSYDSIESDIARAREDLATTLDEIIDRVSPSALADEGKAKATALAKNPKVMAVVGAVAAIAVAGLIGKSVSNRKQRRRVEEYLAARR